MLTSLSQWLMEDKTLRDANFPQFRAVHPSCGPVKPRDFHLASSRPVLHPCEFPITHTLIVVGACYGEFAGVQYRVRAGQVKIQWFYWATTGIHCPEPGKDWCHGESCWFGATWPIRLPISSPDLSELELTLQDVGG